MNLLAVKLAGIGDVLTATPALRALRRAFPHGRITALISPQCRELLEGSPLVDNLILFDKARFDRVTGRGTLSGFRNLGRLAWNLRRGGYDAVLVLHHLTLAAGAGKYAALAMATGAPIRAGLDNGRGWFLTHHVPDNGFGAMHEVEYCNQVVALLGATPDYGPLELPPLSDQDRLAAEEALAGAPRPRIILHPSTGEYSAARRWPAARFLALAEALLEDHGGSIVLVGGGEEAALTAAINQRLGGKAVDLAGRTTLRQLAAVLQRCDAFAGNDSGIMHLAAAAGIPLVALFGPSNYRAWGPWPGSAPAVVLRADLSCSPCLYPKGLGTPEGCPNRTCLQLITVDQVRRAVGRLLEHRSLAAPHPGRQAP